MSHQDIKLLTLQSKITIFIQVQNYLPTAGETSISWALIHAAVSSVARTTIMPMQDILGLGSSDGMNTPEIKGM